MPQFQFPAPAGASPTVASYTVVPVAVGGRALNLVTVVVDDDGASVLLAPVEYRAYAEDAFGANAVVVGVGDPEPGLEYTHVQRLLFRGTPEAPAPDPAAFVGAWAPRGAEAGAAGEAPTRVRGGLGPARALLRRNANVFWAGDSYCNPATDRVPFQSANFWAAEGHTPPLRGLYLTNAEGAGVRNFGGFYLYATGAGHKLLSSADGYAAVGGAEHVGLPTWTNEVHVTDALVLGGDGRLCYFRFETEGNAAAGDGALVAPADAGQAIEARVVAYAPHTAGALLDAAIGLRDRVSGSPNVATVNPAQGTGLPDGAPAPGTFYRFPDVELDNAAGSPAWYGALLALDGQAAGAAPDLDEYLHLAGCLVHRPDRATGPTHLILGEASWGYEGWGLDADPAVADDKRFRDVDLETWLGAVRLDVDQPAVVVVHLNNEQSPSAGSVADRVQHFRPLVARLRERWVRLATAAGYGEVAVVFVHGQGQGSVSADNNEALLQAIRQESETHAGCGYVSLWADNENLTLAGSADAADYLGRAGEAALAAGGGDLLDEAEVHPADDVAAAFWARRLAAHLFPA